MKKHALRILALLICLLVAPAGLTYASSKIDISPNPISINEGYYQIFTVLPTEPIIAMSGPGTLDINFTSSDPARIKLSVSSLHFDESSWSQSQNFTINTVDDGVYNDGENATISYTVVSNSEYYNGYTGSVGITLDDIDSSPAAAPPAASGGTTTPSASSSSKKNSSNPTSSSPPTTSKSSEETPKSTGTDKKPKPNNVKSSTRKLKAKNANATWQLGGSLILLLLAALIIAWRLRPQLMAFYYSKHATKKS